MEQIKLVIFDLDGTLVNTIEDLGTSTNVALKQNGYPTHPLEVYKQFVGNGIYKLVWRALPEEARTEVIIKQVLETFITYYNGHLTDFSKPYEGIYELLHTLRERGVQVAIATNKPHAQAIKLVEACFPDIKFLDVSGNQEGIPHKPNPYTVERIIEKAGVQLAEVLYVGDSDVDMQTAVNASVYGIGVSWGFRSIEELWENGANAVVKEARQILDYLDCR